MKAILISFLLLFSLACSASYKETLHRQMRQNHSNPLTDYRQSRTFLFGYLHLWRGTVTDVYCNESFNKADGVGKGKIPNPNKVNAEHTHPRSKFNRNFSFNIQLADLHNLFPAKSRANSARSNYEFADVNGPALFYCIHSKLGNRQFEVPDWHKGNVARAKFYMSVRYKIPISKNEERTLRRWHIIDPVDEFELWRNYQIQDIQGNSNPFILEPKLVNYIQDF